MSGGGGSPDPFPGSDILGQLGTWGAGGQGGGSGSSDPCTDLRFTARLRSVDADEADLVDVGDGLVVALFNDGRPQIGAFRITGENPLATATTPVGVLLDRIAELVPCLQRYRYRADVTRIDGGDITVTVYSSGPAS